MLQNPRKTLGFKKNMVYKIPPGGGGRPYPASGLFRERSGSVVECLTEDRGAMGSSLAGVTVLWSLTGSTQEDLSLFN